MRIIDRSWTCHTRFFFFFIVESYTLNTMTYKIVSRYWRYKLLIFAED